MDEKIYLDACCLNLPFDDQTQTRIQMESEAVLQILKLAKNGKITWLSSEILEFELENIKDTEKREKIIGLLEYAKEVIELDDIIQERALEYEKLGFQSLDALHIASALCGKAETVLTTDDKLERNGKRNQAKLGIKIDNPLNWIRDII